MPIIKNKISGQKSKVMTFGDPKDYSNKKSDREFNNQLKPERPGKSEPNG